jgi:uncharacterized lipoprotein YddW (UPF0748 family)
MIRFGFGATDKRRLLEGLTTFLCSCWLLLGASAAAPAASREANPGAERARGVLGVSAAGDGAVQGRNDGAVRPRDSGLARPRDSGLARPRDEVRGLWVVRHTLSSPQKVRRLVAAARENGFNAIFAQVRGRGETYYKSSIDPVARVLVPDGEGGRTERVADTTEVDSGADLADLAASQEVTFDPLGLLVELAHESGIAVHAWVNTYFTWSEELPHPSPLHVINRHPEWIAADRYGVRLDRVGPGELRPRYIEGLYLSPASREARRYLADVVLEIVSRYPVDGVHLDYVRYPGRDAGLDEYSRSEFHRLYGFDPMDFLEASGGSPVPIDTHWAVDLEGAWRRWRAEQVTALVSLISSEARERRPDIILSAAVKFDPSAAAMDYGQDWAEWLEDGLIDLAAPMIYTESTLKFFDSVRRLRREIPDSLETRILAGVSLYNQTPRHAAEKIDVARAAGLGGFVLFSYDSAIDWKGAPYLPALKPLILGWTGGSESLDRTASSR